MSPFRRLCFEARAALDISVSIFSIHSSRIVDEIRWMDRDERKENSMLKKVYIEYSGE